MGGGDEVDEALRQLVEFGAQPREVDEFGVGIGVGMLGGGGEIGDERSEEGLE